MNENLRRAYELLKEASSRDDGDELIALCAEAMREADLSGQLAMQYLAREQFVRACFFGGEPERALVGFSWLVTQFDKNPGKFSERDILWKYKWIIELICHFPQIPKARIYEMLGDFEARAACIGYGLRAVYYMRYRVEKFWDSRNEALKYFRKLAELPRDDLSNCPACDLDDRVSFAIYCGDDERAVELALPLLNGERKCTTVPHRTYAYVLLPLVRLGRQSEALGYHRQGYALIRNNKRFLDKVAEHLIFLVLTENLDEALSLFQKHFQWIEQSRDLFCHFHFFRAAWLLFDRLAEQRSEPIRLRLPESFPKHTASGCYDAESLAVWFKENARELAKRFDARNGTEHFWRTLNETP